MPIHDSGGSCSSSSILSRAFEIRSRAKPSVQFFGTSSDDGIWADVAALLTQAVRQKHGRPADPSTGILDSQSVVSGPQKGPRGFDGNKKIKSLSPRRRGGSSVMS